MAFVLHTLAELAGSREIHIEFTLFSLTKPLDCVTLGVVLDHRAVQGFVPLKTHTQRRHTS